LILHSIIEQNGKVNKKSVLDFLETNNLIHLSDSDKEILESRNEIKWRNELAFVRQHLVKDAYLNNLERSFWEITQKGRRYFDVIKLSLEGKELIRISNNQIITKNNDLNVLNSESANELFEDNLELKNETIEKKISTIKRYQKIVEDIKLKYDSKCQISDCQHTFKKENGENYSEGHHLKPLSQGGSQNESNLVILCANHHRMFHYASIEIKERIDNTRKIILNNQEKVIEYK
jgi:predicted HNH restriction endonuclease